MTYQSFEIERSLVACATPAAPQPDTVLGKLEWDAVEIARRDGPHGGDPRSLRARLSRIFGLRIVRPLANERLEAIRRFSVRAWFGRELKEKDIRLLFNVGLSSNDVWRLLAHIGERRGFVPEVEAWPA